VQRHAEPGAEFCCGGGLWEGPRETVQDVAAAGGRLDDGRGQQFEHRLVGDEIAASLVGRDLAAKPVLGVGGPEQVTRADVPHLEPRC
jgi:hypothetical protein